MLSDINLITILSDFYDDYILISDIDKIKKYTLTLNNNQTIMTVLSTHERDVTIKINTIWLSLYYINGNANSYTIILNCEGLYKHMMKQITFFEKVSDYNMILSTIYMLDDDRFEYILSINRIHLLIDVLNKFNNLKNGKQIFIINKIKTHLYDNKKILKNIDFKDIIANLQEMNHESLSYINIKKTNFFINKY